MILVFLTPNHATNRQKFGPSCVCDYSSWFLKCSCKLYATFAAYVLKVCLWKHLFGFYYTGQLVRKPQKSSNQRNDQKLLQKQEKKCKKVSPRILAGSYHFSNQVPSCSVLPKKNFFARILPGSCLPRILVNMLTVVLAFLF